jgi:hypothetical protein
MHRKLTLLAFFLTASCLQATENGRYVRLEIPELPTIGDGRHEMRRMLEIAHPCSKSAAPHGKTTRARRLVAAHSLN